MVVNKMLSLYDDIIIKITGELSDKEKIDMTMLSKQFDDSNSNLFIRN